MKLQSLMLRNSLLILTFTSRAPGLPRHQRNPNRKQVRAATSQSPSPFPRAHHPGDRRKTQLGALPRQTSTPSPARKFDQGVVSEMAVPMKRMDAHPAAQSRTAKPPLSKFMDEQLSKDSPNFHNWLTPGTVWQAVRPGGTRDIQTVNRLASTPGISANQGGSRFAQPSSSPGTWRRSAMRSHTENPSIQCEQPIPPGPT